MEIHCYVDLPDDALEELKQAGYPRKAEFGDYVLNRKPGTFRYYVGEEIDGFLPDQFPPPVLAGLPLKITEVHLIAKRADPIIPDGSYDPPHVGRHGRSSAIAWTEPDNTLADPRDLQTIEVRGHPDDYAEVRDWFLRLIRGQIDEPTEAPAPAAATATASAPTPAPSPAPTPAPNPEPTPSPVDGVVVTRPELGQLSADLTAITDAIPQDGNWGSGDRSIRFWDSLNHLRGLVAQIVARDQTTSS